MRPVLATSLFGCLLGCLLCFALPAAGQVEDAAQASEPPGLELGQDRFVAADRVVITRRVEGDLLAAGGEITVGEGVAGDLIAAGGKVLIDSPVQQDALVVGGEVILAGTVNRNARFAGGTVTLERGALVNGSATFGGSELNVAGEVAGYLLAGGGRIYINGPIGGDVRVAGADIELGPDARIQGSVLYRSPNEMKRAPGAQIAGTVRRLPLDGSMRSRGHRPVIGLLLWSVGLGIVATIMLTAAPAFAARVSSTLRGKPGASLLLGLAALLVMPLAIIIAFITIVGIPAGLLALLAYPILLLIGYVCGAVALADVALGRLQPAHATARGRRIIAAVIALLILGLLTRIPFAGGVLGLLLLLAGVGALLLQVRGASASHPA